MVVVLCEGKSSSWQLLAEPAPHFAASGLPLRVDAAMSVTSFIPSMASSALETGKAFLEENAQKPGVITTASGLQYLVLTEGTGMSPKAKDTVVVNYRGTLINGVEFDSSYLAGREPAEFPLKRVIKGWTEGLQLMKEGAKYRFFIPSQLAYGKRGSGLDIRPDETLIFEVELLKVWED